MNKRTQEITYLPGSLASKLGISKFSLMNHLRATGLIEQCWLTEYGHWRIPYSVAVQLASPEALAVTAQPRMERHKPAVEGVVTTHRRKPASGVGELTLGGGVLTKRRKRKLEPEDRRQGSPPQPIYHEPNYGEIGKALSKAGITLADLVRYIEQQHMEVTHEQQKKNNSAKRDEGEKNEPKSS